MPSAEINAPAFYAAAETFALSAASLPALESSIPGVPKATASSLSPTSVTPSTQFIATSTQTVVHFLAQKPWCERISCVRSAGE